MTRDLTVKEQVKKQAFQLIKVSEDGEQTETDLVAGAGFKVYLILSLIHIYAVKRTRQEMKKAEKQYTR